MPMLALGPALDRLVRSVFPDAKDQNVVRRALERECGANLECSPGELERVRTAVLKASGGGMTAFRSAVYLAKEDWRDVLVAAGFDRDATAHERWRP